MTLFGYLMAGVAGIFWLFRVIVAFCATTGKAFSIVPLNVTAEIVVIFISFIGIVLVLKRKMLGAIIYMISNFAYFGVDLYKSIASIIEEGTSISSHPNLIFSAIGVILPFLIFANIGLNTGKKSAGNNKNTDWFYKTTEHDRVYDERADRNQYKF